MRVRSATWRIGVLPTNSPGLVKIFRIVPWQGATITVWGVGTKLATAFDQPALGGVYKLSALRNPGGEWDYKMKISDQAAKTSTPGILQVRRFRRGGQNIADAILEEGSCPPGECVMVGDDWGNDIVPSRQAGLHAYWLNETAPWPDELNHHARGTLAALGRRLSEGKLDELWAQA
jgi:nicotinic acid phosphoribosyltransferase